MPEPEDSHVSDTPSKIEVGSGSILGPDDLRKLAELLYKLMKEDLRIERERLGR